MRRYKSLTRTTMASLDGLPHVGLYVLAYMGTVLYVGKAENSVTERIQGHLRGLSRIGSWLLNTGDWGNVRLDVLEPPDSEDASWLRKGEEALIRQFKPLFNTSLSV